MNPVARRWIVQVFGLKFWAWTAFLVVLGVIVLSWIVATWPNLLKPQMGWTL